MSENESQDSPVSPGTILAGKYRVERIIGQGGMGIVVEARHIALDERVALKFLLPDYAQHPEAAARFLREARAAVKIKSEHVARVSDVGTLDNSSPYMVMEFLEGDDLSKILEKRGVLAIPEAIDYLIQGCEAIAEAHTHGIVHRDIKPANLFLTRRQDGYPLVKVLDFGISKTMGNVENLTKTMAAMGSALYMSPEQMQQTRSVDHRTDIYALGISLYELLAGKQPFYAETLPQLCAEILTGTPTPIREARPDVAEPLAIVIEKAYARDRANRYGSVAELVVALAPWAPAATRNTIERIARMGGIPLPAMDARHSVPSMTTPQPALGGTIALTGGPPQALSQSQPSLSQSQPSGQIQLGHYAAPASARASAAFASHAGTTNANLSATGGFTSRPSQSKAPLIVSVGLGVIAVAALAGVLISRRGGASPAASTDAPAMSAPTASASASAAPAAPAASSAAPTATASASASATPSAAPSAEPAATPTAAPEASASTAAHVPPPHAGGGWHPRPRASTPPPAAPPPRPPSNNGGNIDSLPTVRFGQ